MRIGIDVGGTNTDAVVMDGKTVVGWFKTPTTLDVTSGITTALASLLQQTGVAVNKITGVMIGTTHFTNAVVERRRLMPTAIIRIGLPATQSLPPMTDWPDDLRQAIGNHSYLVHGGHEFDGREITPINEEEIIRVAREIKTKKIRAIAISAVFSPTNPEHERRVARIVQAEIPEASITISSDIGRLSLLERENAAIMNACLGDLAEKIIGAFKQALIEMKITAPFFLSQNDGTLMGADFVKRFPVFTFSSGPTNSMRGAAFLSGVKDGMVVDIGGTTSDVGMLVNGFPREASTAIRVGGVRTNFRMPDVLSIGLGGGSLVVADPLSVGPTSVGYEITKRALVFGGSETTTTDIAVAAGVASVGEKAKVNHLEAPFVKSALEKIQNIIDVAVDRMKINPDPLPVILVGGGSILVSKKIQGASEMIKPDHFSVANAIGAAIAQVGGETDRIFSLDKTAREQALEEAKNEAIQKALISGAIKESIQIVEVEEIPLSYLPSNAVRIRVKAIGDLALG